MQRGLLVEVVDSPVEILEEAKAENGNRMRVKAGLMSANVRNRNQRVYKKEIVDREVGRLQERIQSKVAFGSGDHPSDGRTSFDNVTHLWEKVWTHGNKVLGEAVVLNTDRGRNLQEIIRVAGTVPVSARGFGRTSAGQWEGQPADMVEDNYELVTFDFVLNNQGFEDAKVTKVTEEEGGGNMDRAQLEKDFPTIVKEIVDEAVKKKEEELLKAFEERVLAKIAEERDRIKEAVKAELEEEYSDRVDILEQIAALIAPYAGAPEHKASDDAETKTLKAQVEKLTQDLQKVGQGLKEAEAKVASKDAELEAAKVPAKIAEVVKGKVYGVHLSDALKDCKTTKEVEARLPIEEEKLSKIFKSHPELATKGKGEVEKPADDTPEGQLTEDQKRQQRLAGVAS